MKTTGLLVRLSAAELAFCEHVHNHAHRSIRRGLAFVSRVADGWFYLGLAISLAIVYGPDALPLVLEMTLATALGVAAYALLKRGTARPRPYEVTDALEAVVPALDRYSFPSGHTLHAVSFAALGTHAQPELAWLLVPWAVAVAASRVVLGLHYPTDVAAGAGLGGAIAAGVIAI